ncbi:flagellar hook protein FlgE [sulfur-oxidizing endosymbiont of Gigantopelta aegis]|uniref:flagellar hook protein FlgE n=1 Tax=sulfur-oxidizing endosymbiont of Gigantopelta aegis TaxID=2794934 RepID=UPI0018DDA2A2|nr:flagellar hook protein FlgE [sulfur-oxidizing endosymbiont of Gigantopelta aegis]
MPFRIGLSGLNAAQADLKITGNNIANVSTIGFKQSRAEFADVYATSKFGSVSTAIGSGVRLAAASQQFTQGNIIFTENNLDLGITGEGFFSMDDVSGNRIYTRNGQFKTDKNGVIVDNSGSSLKGYGVDPVTNNINTGSIVDLQIISTNIAPNPTTASTLIANIDSGGGVPANVFSMNSAGTVDPQSYNHTTSFTSYDSLGNPMLTSLFFRKTATNTWDVGIKQVDANGNIFQNIDAGATQAGSPTQPQMLYNGAVSVPALDVTISPLESITFLNNGTLDSSSLSGTSGTFSFTVDLASSDLTNPVMTPTGGALQTQPISVDLNGLTQYGANFGVTNLTQDGYTTGQLSGIGVDQSGIISARFTNGQSNNLGQVFLTTFTNTQGLSQLGDNYWGESFSSGQGIINAPGNGNAGLINSGALEDSNVDLTAQLINLITAQRNFQANAKTITTADTITQTVIQL